jgi:hypothetical protein
VGLSIAEHLAAGRGSTCQIHQGLTASGGLDGGRGAGKRIVFARPGHAKLDLGPMPPEEACPVIAAIHDRRSQDESERGARITTELGAIAGGGGPSRLHLHRDRHL